MTDDPKDDAGAGIAFGVSRARRTHGLLIAGVLAAAGFAALVFAGPGLPDGEIIGVVNLALAGGVAVYVLRATRDPGVGMVLDDEGVWFSDWALPPVPWRHVQGARVAGSRLRPLLYVELRDPEIFFARVDDAARAPRRANPLVRETRLLVPNGALDAPLGKVAAAIREAHERATAAPLDSPEIT